MTRHISRDIVMLVAGAALFAFAFARAMADENSMGSKQATDKAQVPAVSGQKAAAPVPDKTSGPAPKPENTAAPAAVPVPEGGTQRGIRPRLDTSLASIPADKPIPMDRIVAVVNDEVITQFELNDRMNLFITQLRKQGTPLPERAALARQVLERMISDAVQLQLAKQTGLHVDDGQLDRTLQRIAQENKLSLTEFRAALEQDGISFPKFRDEIRNEMILARLREREVDNKITVTDSEVQNELAVEATQGARDEEYQIAHILISVPEQAPQEQVKLRRDRAEEALAKLQQGSDFGQIAAAYSDSSDALEGGNLAWRPTARLPTVYVEQAAKLKPGELSPVFRSPAGFHIVKLVEKRGKSVTQVVTQYHVRHILIRPTENLSDPDAKTRILNLKERLDNSEDFAELARAISDDDSKVKGGDIGWISPGETVPEFEHAIEALQPGQIGGPLQTPMGWHIVQLLETRQSDVSQERLRLAARQGVRARKSDEAFSDWLHQLRDGAYIEYRLDEK